MYNASLSGFADAKAPQRMRLPDGFLYQGRVALTPASCSGSMWDPQCVCPNGYTLVHLPGSRYVGGTKTNPTYEFRWEPRCILTADIPKLTRVPEDRISPKIKARLADFPSLKKPQAQHFPPGTMPPLRPSTIGPLGPHGEKQSVTDLFKAETIPASHVGPLVIGGSNKYTCPSSYTLISDPSCKSIGGCVPRCAETSKAAQLQQRLMQVQFQTDQKAGLTQVPLKVPRQEGETTKVIPMSQELPEVIDEKIPEDLKEKKKGIPLWGWGLILGGGGLVVGGALTGIIMARR